MLDLAIICSTFPERNRLLHRSAQTWKSSIEASGLDAEYFVYYNGMNMAWTFESEEARKEGERHAYMYERSGSHIAGYNYWMERVEAKKYLFTHPDILFPANTVRVAYETAKPNTYAAFKVFWIPQQMTEEIEKHDWRHPEKLEEELLKYPNDSSHGDFYWNSDVHEKTEWHSTTTFCIDSELAHMLYPFPDLAVQGYDDPLHYMVRGNADVKDVCIMNPVLMHQWHPSSWNGDSRLATQQAWSLYHSHYEEKVKAWKKVHSVRSS